MLDLRALSLMRIGIALLVLTDLCIRAGDLSAHYTDEGIWPVELVRNFGWNSGYWSLHALNGSFAWIASLFLLHFCFAVCLLLGFKTRFFTVLVWLFTISLHNRNLFVLQGGDDLLRLILLWGIFLPWNAHYSIDSRQHPVNRQQSTFANLGYLLLLASVYFFSANLKYGIQWKEGSAVYYALSLEQLRLPIGTFIYQYPGLLKLLTWLVLAGEYLVVLLVLVPAKKGGTRLMAFLLIALLHLGFGLTLYVGLFFLIGMASALGLLPASVMDRVDLLLKRTPAVAAGHGKRSPLLRKATNAVSALLIFLCLLVNLATVTWFPMEMRDELAYGSNVLRLNQYWGMFSPDVLKKDGWYVFHGMDSIGRQWDLRSNSEYVNYQKPEHIVSMYKNDRWRKLAENMQVETYTFLRPRYCNYILHSWNKRHPEKMMFSLRVLFMEKENLPGYTSTVPVKTLHCVCYDH